MNPWVDCLSPYWHMYRTLHFGYKLIKNFIWWVWEKTVLKLPTTTMAWAVLCCGVDKKNHICTLGFYRWFPSSTVPLLFATVNPITPPPKKPLCSSERRIVKVCPYSKLFVLHHLHLFPGYPTKCARVARCFPEWCCDSLTLYTRRVHYL